MKLTLDSGEGRCRVLSGEAHRVEVLYLSPSPTGEPQGMRPERLVFDSSVLISLDDARAWRPGGHSDLRRSDFRELLDHAPEIVVYGTGEKLRFPAPDLIRDLADAGVGIEVMNTPAACRTFNVLMMEGRRVVAVLLLES